MRTLKSATWCRLFIVLFLVYLCVDLARTGVCCADDAAPSRPLSTLGVSSLTTASHHARHRGDDCFCCARVSVTAVGVIISLPELPVPAAAPNASPLVPEGASLYHPPPVRG